VGRTGLLIFVCLGQFVLFGYGFVDFVLSLATSSRNGARGPTVRLGPGCTKYQPPRPILRPILGHFVFLGPSAKIISSVAVL
jgi:hypothetical protein